MSYSLTIENHPAQARHPFTSEPLVDNDGLPVPLFPDQRSIKLDGRLIAYVSNERKIMFLVPLGKLGVIAKEAEELVNKEMGAVQKVTSVREPAPETIETEDDY